MDYVDESLSNSRGWFKIINPETGKHHWEFRGKYTRGRDGLGLRERAYDGLDLIDNDRRG